MFTSPSSPTMQYEFTPTSASLAAALLVSIVLVVNRMRNNTFIAKVPGPPTPSWIFGNMMQFVFPRVYGEHEFEWQRKYGPVYKIKGVFGEDRLLISDPTALQYIINNRNFIRAPVQWQIGRMVFGEGSVYCAEGEQHRRLRTALSPGFSASVVRSFTSVFSEIARRIVQEWDKSCPPGSPALVNVCEVIDRGTLDIISEAALGSPLNTVAYPENPLAQSHLHVLEAAFSRSKYDLIADIIIPYVPMFMLNAAVRLAPAKAFRALRSFRDVTDRMGSQLMKEKMEAQENGVDQSNDMLSILIKGLTGARKKNATADDLAEQIRLILLGGQDTSADSLAWSLHELAKDQDYQQKLRAEIQSYRSSVQRAEIDYDSLPLLNALLKETLRMYPIAAWLERKATEDSVIPLGYELTTTSGERISQLPVKKGQWIGVQIASYQRFEPLWGHDAHEFRPSRWLDGNPCKGQALGPYAHLLTFAGGFRPCAGWRFSILEMQIILAELVANFSFAPSKNHPVKPLYTGVLAPITEAGVKGLPLIIERIVQ